MMQFSRHVVLGCFLVALTGCVTTYTPPKQVAVTKSVTVQAPADKVWQAVIRYFGENNIPIENMDRGSYFIKTKPVDISVVFMPGTTNPKAVPLKNALCDCGDATIGNVWGSSQQISVSFNVVLSTPTSNVTEATTNVFFEGVKLGQRNAYASGYDVTMPLKCVSTGKLEGELQTYLQTHAGSGTSPN